MTDCEHPLDEMFWYTDFHNTDTKRSALNEEGWHCIGCLADLGYRPDLDRDRIEMKAHCVLMDFHESKLIYVSNGTMGEIIAANVAGRCRQEDRYDQWSILRYILDDPNLNSHGDFWANRAERWFLGAEPIRQEQEALPFSG